MPLVAVYKAKVIINEILISIKVIYFPFLYKGKTVQTFRKPFSFLSNQEEHSEPINTNDW